MTYYAINNSKPFRLFIISASNDRKVKVTLRIPQEKKRKIIKKEKKQSRMTKQNERFN